VDDLKAKIHSLRTQYFREAKKLPTGTAAKKRKVWKYLEVLRFLSEGDIVTENRSNLETAATVQDIQFIDGDIENNFEGDR
jgi:alcohol dehydrogenase Myb-SANT-like transcription factor